MMAGSTVLETRLIMCSNGVTGGLAVRPSSCLIHLTVASSVNQEMVHFHSASAGSRVFDPTVTLCNYHSAFVQLAYLTLPNLLGKAFLSYSTVTSGGPSAHF